MSLEPKSWEPNEWQAGPCEHVEWPAHSAINSGPRFEELQPASYKPRDLLNNTVAYFQLAEELLTKPQIAARDEFISLFENPETQRDLTTDDEDLLARVAELVDDFFFFGSLTHERPDDEIYGAKKYIRTCIESIELCGKDVNGYTETDDAGYPFYKCVVIDEHRSNDDGDPNVPNTLPEAVSTMVHEMAHAYLEVFGCGMGKCYTNILNNVGASGHGPIFQSLFASMILTIRDWSDELADFCINEVDPVGVDQHILECEDARIGLWENVKTFVIRGVRKEERKFLVHMSGEKGLVIRPKLIKDAEKAIYKAWPHLVQSERLKKPRR